MNMFSPPLLRMAWTLVWVGFPAAAGADTWIGAAGSAACRLPNHRVVCPTQTDLKGWVPSRAGTQLQPPSTALDPPVGVTIRVAQEGRCNDNNAWATVVAVAALPSIDATSPVWQVDAGRLDIKGRNLRGSVLRWAAHDKHGSDICRDPQVSGSAADLIETCGFGLDRDLPADLAGLSLWLLPAGSPPEGDIIVFDAQGSPTPMDAWRVTPARVVLSSLVDADAALDTEAEVGRLTLRHADAIGSVECVDAICDLEGADLLVRGEHGADAIIDIHVRLRPHVFYQGPQSLETVAVISIPLQRCPLATASAPPLRGVQNQRMVLRLGGRCRNDRTLRFFASGAPAPVLGRYEEDDAVYVTLQVDRANGDDITVSAQRASSIVGMTRVSTRARPSSTHIRLELSGLGPIDFVPTNRDAQVVLPSIGEAGTFVVMPVDGVYTVTHDASGVDKLRGLDGATGWISLRLAYRDKTLPLPLRSLNLAEIVDPVERGVKVANIPVILDNENNALAELVCNDADDKAQRLRPGAVNAVPYSARDSCHIILHRERLHLVDGEQTIRITASVNAVDGAPRPEAVLDQVVRLRPGVAPRVVYIGGVAAPFDRVVVRIAVLSDDVHYAAATEEKVGAPPLQWSIVMGTTKFRFSATTSFPTGLFRVADAGHSGILGLNGGVLFRLLWLTQEGHQSPVAWESGVMWMGIAGDTTAAAGQIAVVTGLGIGVPIANVSRATQASISLHAWLEYEVSRAVLGQSGSAWGFVFGPSLSVGDVGVNF